MGPRPSRELSPWPPLAQRLWALERTAVDRTMPAMKKGPKRKRWPAVDGQGASRSPLQTARAIRSPIMAKTFGSKPCWNTSVRRPCAWDMYEFFQFPSSFIFPSSVLSDGLTVARYPLHAIADHRRRQPGVRRIEIQQSPRMTGEESRVGKRAPIVLLGHTNVAKSENYPVPW